MIPKTESSSEFLKSVPVIIVDVPITLRKRMTFVMAKASVVEFSGSSFEDALQFLWDHERTQGEVISPTGVWSVTRVRDITKEEEEKWLGQRHRY